MGSGDEFRDLIARYIHANFGALGLVVYVEVPLGKTIVGKNRRLDLFVLRLLVPEPSGAVRTEDVAAG